MLTKNLVLIVLFTLFINCVHAQTTVVFNCGNGQNWVVPPCVTSINVTVEGAQGGGSAGGLGAVVTATIPVTAGQTLQINVGCQGGSPGAGSNGGGSGYAGQGNSGGGGGASDIRIAPYALGNRIIVAGGGGGAGGGSPTVGTGGAGGCATGSTGTGSPYQTTGGTGGSQSTGGTGGPPWSGGGTWGSNGTLGQGGNGGFWNTASGGGGGGGYYGGGGGGSDGCCTGSNGGAGGGGGSSLTPAGGNCSMGTNSGPGVVSITFTPGVPVVASNTGPYCAGATIQLNTPSTGTYSWTGPNSFASTLQNPTIPTSTTAMSGVYTVTVTSPSGCVSSATTTVTVNPTPTVTVPANNSYCNGTAVPASSFASLPAGGTFSWINSNTAIGLAASGTGNTPVFTATNNTGATISGTIIVTSTLNGCVGTPSNYTITVYPTPTVTVPASATYCNGVAVPASNFTSTPAGGTFSWTNTNAAIGLAASGAGNTPAFMATNLTGTTISGTITVTPTANGCIGTSSNYTISVNPTPTVTVPASATYCAGDPVLASAFTSNVVGATFAWTNTNSAIGLAASGTGNTPTFTSANTTGLPIISTITVTPTANGCVGTPSSYTITVNPIPAAPTALSITICPNNSTTLTATAPGGTYEWYDAPVAGTLLITNASYTTPVLSTTTTYYVQTTINGCVGPRTAVTVTISPLLIVDAGLNDSICFGDSYTLGVIPNGVGYSYVWDEPTNMGFSNIFNPTVTPTATTTYTVTVTDPNNCVGSDTVIIFADPELLLTMGITNVSCNSFCDGQTTVVVNGGTTPYNYSWSSGGTTNTETNLCPNLYTVTVTDDFGCSATGDTTVTEPSAITVNITSTVNPLCNGACNGSITASASGGTSTLTYSIDGVNFQATGVFNNLCAGNYLITVQDANLCQNTTTTSLTNPALLVINSITPTDVSCNGGSNGTITINASGGTGALSYSINNGVTFSGSSNFIGLLAGSYTIVVKDANGCTVNGGIVDIFQPLQLSITDTLSNANCYGSSDGWISVTPLGGTLPYAYSWSSGGNNSIASNLSAGSYTVTVTDANGCTIVSSFIITQPNPINFVTFSADTFVGCVPFPVTFYNTTDPNLVSAYLWDFGDGGSASLDTVTHTYTTSGTYDVVLTITDTNGCVGVHSEYSYITVSELPTASFTMNPTSSTVFDPTIHFYDQSFYNIATWSWDFNGLGNSNIQYPTFLFPEDTGTYVITLTVSNLIGCTSSTSNTVTILGEFGIYVPNAFTPDGNGENDTFFPKGFGITNKDYSFVIFDRWGELIFETHSIERGWDGTYKGKLVPNGIYVWNLSFIDINGKKHLNKIGNVTIVK